MLLTGLTGCGASGTATDPTSAPTSPPEPSVEASPSEVTLVAEPAALVAPPGAVAHYPLETDLESTVDGAPALRPIRDVELVPDDDTSGASAAAFAIDGGFVLDVGDLIGPEEYTIAFRAYFDRALRAFFKLVDFGDRKGDEGFYVHGEGLVFYGLQADTGGTAPIGGPPFATIVLRRDASGTINWFVEGQLAGEADDSEAGFGVVGDRLFFFVDDQFDDSGPEHAPGRVAWITLFDEALDNEQIATLTR